MNRDRTEKLLMGGACTTELFFFQRMEKREPEADFMVIKNALSTLRGLMGVENKYVASNEDSSKPSRLLLLQAVRNKVSEIITNSFQGAVQEEDDKEKSGESPRFHKHFHAEPLNNVVLDYDGVDKKGKPRTMEGRIKHFILNGEDSLNHIIAIRSIGGVGKSTILKDLASDKDLRERFYDGIHFISLGMNATEDTLFRRVRKIMRDSTVGENSFEFEEDLKCALDAEDSWSQDRNCAFLMDDVWTTNIPLTCSQAYAT